MTDIPLLTNIPDEEEIMLKAKQILAEAKGGASEQSAAIDQVALLLADLDEGTADLFIDELSKRFKITKKIFRSKLRKALDEKASKNGGLMLLDPEISLPEGINQEQAVKKGFFQAHNSYFFLTKDGHYRASNFVVKPILHIYSKTDNKRIIEVVNEHGERKTLDLPSKNLVSTDLFQQSVFNEGNFIFFGTKLHHYRILSDIAREFPVANELRTLGWQREGFFAFSNGIFNGAWHPVDEFGVTEHQKVRYFAPAFSKIYADVREDDDEYENDRFFVYKESPVDWTRWCELMIQVYGEKAMIAIAFLVASLLRDMIYERYKMFPHLFLFGEKQSGKSQLGWSLSNVFFDRMPAFNLNSGTQVGFFRRLSRVKNALVWFDEYTNDVDEKRFQALKASYDGAGHEKGRMTRDNRTDVTKVNSACVISGQYLPTRDDNALLTRSILLLFEKRTYDADGIRAFDELKELESRGLASLATGVLKHRKLFEDDYIRAFSAEFDYLKNYLQDHALPYDERMVRNYASIIAPMRVIHDHGLLKNPFDHVDLQQHCIDRIADQTSQISSSESVSTFWMLIQFMFEASPQMINHGEDFKIEMIAKPLKLKNKRDVTEVVDFSTEPRKLIFFRFVKIHPLYMEYHRKQYGKNGVDYVSLQHYIKHHRAYVGYTESTRFDNQITSAYVFDYNKLGINLEKEAQNYHDPDPSEPDYVAPEPGEVELPF